MERESFEDSDVAKLLNENYIAIKVDREERKDLDAIYMKACQVITGTGGWPLNLWLTPDKLPIYAGTYFPKRAMANRIGFMDALSHISKLFAENPQAIFNKSFELVTSLKRSENRKPGSLKESIIEEVDQDFRDSFDAEFGGFSKPPKFPTPHQLMYLLESSELGLQHMAISTLEHMARGGIYDHIGGGFSRYSVDNQWMIPHFEKMLYDNGLLLDVYCKAYEITHNESFKVIALEIVEFIKKELKHDQGGFYCAYDADSEGVEGKFYRFSHQEIIEVLGSEEGKIFCDAYHVTTYGNFEGFTVINLIEGDLETLLRQDIRHMRDKLLLYRNQRVKPSLDDKILSLSNGYAIHGLLSVFETFEQQEDLDLAKDADRYLQKYLLDEGYLYASARDGKKGARGTIDDYASVIRYLLKLFMITQENAYLTRSIELIHRTNELFWDEEDHGYFVGESHNRELIFNPKELYDGATPSGNSLMMLNLLQGFLLTDQLEFKLKMDTLIELFGEQLNRYKQFAAYFFRGIRMLQEGTTELAIVVPNEAAKELFLEVYPFASIKKKYSFDVYKIEVDPNRCIELHPTVYLCRQGACEQPVLFS